MFVHTGMCLNCVRHTAMLHGCVSPGAPFGIKSVYPTVLTRPRHRACLLIVCGTQASTWVCGRPCDPSQ
ncbi:Uncharacterized protein F383_09453 [Gossypium arboreum]|uniref:Uncharacterized protein n=1 Tax=Gossypium arboreum TaxID=29729 RepID=A0A0B0NJL7_GOSAR|nr:Uncharacterized protein F383_09453 [Gossypium arboreum]